MAVLDSSSASPWFPLHGSRKASKSDLSRLSYYWNASAITYSSHVILRGVYSEEKEWTSTYYTGGNKKGHKYSVM